MSQRFLAWTTVGLRAAAIAAVSLAPILAAGQPPAAAPATAKADPAKKWVMPRTSWGAPDLQGIWDTASGIPLERSKEAGDKTVLTDEDAAAKLERAKRQAQEREEVRLKAGRSSVEASTLTTDQLADLLNVGFPSPLPGTRPQYRRTSLIVDPPDGRIPPLTPEARKRLLEREAARDNRGEADSWEDRNNWERCITRTLPLAMLSTYNSNYQILQTPDHIVILIEMIHEARIIPLDGRQHLNDGLRQWLGDSRGHWEGDTLVVETTNFNNKLDGGPVLPSHPHIVFTHRGSGETLSLIERFTRIDEHTIDYRFTVVDPKTYSRPWTASVPMRNDGTPDRIFEYACHEGNMTMLNLLKGARGDESGALAAARREARDRIAAGQPGVTQR